MEKFEIYASLKTSVNQFLASTPIHRAELRVFDRLLVNDIFSLPEDSIRSSGYVVHTLEASIWCLLTTNSFHDAVLKAVNLGDDTDTTGAVTGGIAGLLYGSAGIPEEWMKQTARFEDIRDLARRMAVSECH